MTAGPEFQRGYARYLPTDDPAAVGASALLGRFIDDPEHPDELGAAATLCGRLANYKNCIPSLKCAVRSWERLKSLIWRTP